MVDQGEQKIIELGYRRLCSDATLQSTKEGFFKDYLINVTEQITPDEFEEFSRKNKDHDRVLFIWTLSAYHTTLKRVQPIYRTKSSEESRIRRETGNVAFKNKEYKSALFSYSQSVIYASYDSEEEAYLALALANRSAVLVHLKEFSMAVRDIQLSLQLGYPTQQRYKLYERLGYCHTQMGDAVKAKVAYDIALNCLCESGLNQSKQVEWKKNINEGVTKLAKIGKVKPKKDPDQPKLPLLLSGPSNEFPSASSAMYVDADQNVGRHFKAKQDIKPGENVATEKAYAACLLTEKLGTHCLHCFVRLIAPLGCFRCRSVAFCSIECRDQAEATYHQFECPVMDVLVGSGMSVLCFVALRMITQQPLSYFLGLRSSLIEDPLQTRVGKAKEPEATPIYDPTDYRNVYNLATLASSRTGPDFLDRTVMALFLLKCLREGGYFGPNQYDDYLSIGEEEVFIATLLLRHLQLLQFNAHEIHEFLQVGDDTMRGTKTAYIGLGIYPTVALFNHSCHPSVGRYFVGTSLVLVSSRTIKANEVVAENYGPMFTSHLRSDRLTRLKGRYWFDCSCLACENKWPTYDGMSYMEDELKRCLFCFGPVKTMSPQNIFSKCKICKKQMRTSDIQEKIDELTQLYRTGLQAMDQMQIDKAVSLLGSFISIMEKVATGPVRERYLAEESLRMCIGTRGTKYSANNHLTLSVKPKTPTKTKTDQDIDNFLSNARM